MISIVFRLGIISGFVHRRMDNIIKTIQIHNLSNVIYFLKLVNHNQEIKTFKIIKN